MYYVYNVYTFQSKFMWRYACYDIFNGKKDKNTE